VTIDRRTLLKGIGLSFVAGSTALLTACGSENAAPDDVTSAGDTAAAATDTTAGSTTTATAAATTEAAPTTTGAPVPVERLTLAGGKFGYPTPFLYTRAPGLANTLMMFDTLLWKDGTGEVIPWLATAWEVSPDGLTWTFTLHDKAMWHDGTPVTADDVAFTFDYLVNGPAKTAPSGIVGKPDIVASVVASDAHTAVFTLARPSATFAVTVAGKVPILPKHIWSAVADPATFREPTALIGSGPYKAGSIDEAAGAYLYTANEAFHLGVPVVRELAFVPTSDELRSLAAGELDGASPASEEGLPDGALAEFENEDYEILQQDGEYARVMQFNLTHGFPYDNVAFRQAVAYAVDRKDLVKRILLGDGLPGSLGGLPPKSPWLAPDLPAYDVDTKKAEELLDSIGMARSGGTGSRTLPDGATFTMTIQVSSRDKEQTSELVKQYLNAVGLDVQLNVLDGAAADSAAAAGEYDAALIGYSLSSDPDSLRIRLSSKVKSMSFSRIQGYVNEEFEKVAGAQSAILDPEARKAPVTAMQKIVAADVPAIPLYHGTSYFVYRVSDFHGFYFTPGSVWGSYPGILNKHGFTTGRTSG
jgi:peptide/nickel transport system substrate-binding protein